MVNDSDFLSEVLDLGNTNYLRRGPPLLQLEVSPQPEHQHVSTS